MNLPTTTMLARLEARVHTLEARDPVTNRNIINKLNRRIRALQVNENSK